jgi:hypothetical protein
MIGNLPDAIGAVLPVGGDKSASFRKLSRSFGAKKVYPVHQAAAAQLGHALLAHSGCIAAYKTIYLTHLPSDSINN